MTDTDYVDDTQHGHDDEAEARKLGWTSRDKWRGKPEEFVEASEFLRRGREVMPILRSQFERTRAENDKLQRELRDTRAEFDKRVKTNERMTQRLLEQQRAQLMRDFEAQKRAAVAAGDTAAYDRVTRQENAELERIAEDNKAAQAEVAKPVKADDTIPDEAKRWANDNPWFFRDPVLKLEAEALHVKLAQEAPGLSLAENLAAVTEQIKQRYPQKFGIKDAADTNSRQSERNYSAVEGSANSRGVPASRTKGWRELPADAREACQHLIERGYLKGDAKTIQDNYAKTYWEEDGK